MTELPVHPTDAEGITPDYLNRLLSEGSAARVTGVAIVEARTYGEQMVSTAGRVVVDVTYAAGTAVDLPTRLVVKLARGIDGILAPFYANEVAFYRRIRPELAHARHQGWTPAGAEARGLARAAPFTTARPARETP